MEEYTRVSRFKAGDMIFNTGDKGDRMYEILEGKVGIYLNYEKPDEKLLVERKPGEFFGEIALIETVPRTAAAVALAETSLRIVGVKDIGPYLNNRPDAIEKILDMMASRVKQERSLREDACRVLADYKKAVDAKETPDDELMAQVENCIAELK